MSNIDFILQVYDVSEILVNQQYIQDSHSLQKLEIAFLIHKQGN